ncbi:MAG: hypothetical protein ABI353_15150 [Isosphaeraceae bacterium]
MRRPFLDSRRPGVPVSLIGMVALVIVIEGSLSSRDLEFITPLRLDWGLAGKAASNQGTGCEVLCFGDSLVKHGVQPAILEAKTGQRVYNLAIQASTAATSYFQLRRAIEAGARPSSIVVDFKPNMLAGRPEFQLQGWQELASLRDALDLAWSARSVSLGVKVLLGRVLPSVRSRDEVRAALVAALHGGPPPWASTNRTLLRQWTINRGANLASKNPAFLGKVSAEAHKNLFSDYWKCHKINARYLERFLDLAGSKGVRVYWLLPPISPELQARRDQSGVDARHTEFVRSVCIRHKDVVVIDGRHAGYDHTVFVDPAHLDGDGAVALSLDLADLLARLDVGSGWVTLPGFRRRPAGIPLEDVNQSQLAVESGDALRR